MDKPLFNEVMANIHSDRFELVEEFLDENQSKFSKDPEYYVLLLNYSFKKGFKSHIVVAKGKAQEGDLELKDQKTGKAVGFIGNRKVNGSELILDGIAKTQEALANFNDRLDIHFGIIHIASKIKKWDIVSAQSVNTLKYSKINDNNWLWGPLNSMDENPKDFMIENIQARTNELFYVGSKEADRALINISEAMIKEYPEIIYGYSNLGVLYLARKQYEQSEKYLKLAMTIAPNDEIVKGNFKKLQEMKE